MKRDNPANIPFLNTTTVVIFLPLLALALLMPRAGMFDSIRSILDHGRWFDYPIIILLSSLYVASLFLILWRSRLGQGLGIFYLSLILMTIHASTIIDLPHSAHPHIIEIGRASHIHGVDVYCNDVYLGQTPMVISEEDFYKKVNPWEQPPRQEIIIWNRNMGSKRGPQDFPEFLYYAPNEYLETYLQNKVRLRPGPRQLWREISKLRYWWHFEKNGCAGVAAININGGAGGGRTITINADPEILYPSVKPHLELLIRSLRRSRYEPTDEWITHFRKYLSLLFHEFYQKSQDETRLTPALQAVVRAEFGISDEMTEKEIARGVDEILARVERVGVFTIPSPESLALDLLGKRTAKVIEKRFAKLATVPIKEEGTQIPGFAGSQITFYRRGKAARLLPLEHAIRQIQPPGLFNRLVYESHRAERFINLLGNYQREEAVRFVRHYLQHVPNGHERHRQFRVTRIAHYFTQIHNPELEGDLRGFVLNNAGAGRHLIGTFIESRLDSSVTNADSLATWLFHETPLDKRDKLKYLSRVNSSRADNLTQVLIQGDYDREEVIRYLAERPNPSFDQFLIDSYEYYLVTKGPGDHTSNLIRAMLVCDTPKMRAYLNELWDEGTDERSFLLEEMSKMEQGDTGLVRWTQTISELTEPFLRLLAVPVLSLIDTPEAAVVLESWAADPDTQLRTLEEHLDNYRERDRQTADLIAGKIKPDDLLPQRTPYIWDGQDYVQELPIAEEQ